MSVEYPNQKISAGQGLLIVIVTLIVILPILFGWMGYVEKQEKEAKRQERRNHFKEIDAAFWRGYKDGQTEAINGHIRYDTTIVKKNGNDSIILIANPNKITHYLLNPD